MSIKAKLNVVHHCYGVNRIPPNSYVETQSPSVTICEDRAFRKYLWLNGVIKVGPNPKDCSPCKKRKRQQSLSTV